MIYDDWKLGNGEPDFYECGSCEKHCQETELEEILGKHICADCKSKLEDETYMVCPYCYCDIKRVGEDGIDVCSEDCGIVEGSAICVNRIELEKLLNGEDI